MKRNFKFKIYRALRNAGLLCKPTSSDLGDLRISRTYMPDGTVIEHGGFVKEAPLNTNSFSSELHIFYEIKKSVTFNN